MTSSLSTGTGDGASAADGEPRSESAAEPTGAPETEDTAAQAWHAMRRLVFDLHDRRGQVSDALQMGYIRAKALVRLVAGPRTMRELAGELATDPPYTTVVVDDLERRELVQRSTHPEDRRVKIVTITDAGRRAAGVAERIQGEPPAALRDLAPADLQTLDRILRQLLSASD